jgi:superfamily I DNA/RNA helicase
MFSKMLMLWTTKAIQVAAKEAQCSEEQIKKIDVRTYDVWFPEWFEKTFGQEIPRKASEVILKTFPQRFDGFCSECKKKTQRQVDLTYKAGGNWATVHQACVSRLVAKKTYMEIDIEELEKIKNDLMTKCPPSIDKTLDIVIDEGQDLPNVFYQLIHQFARSITVYADGAQVINEGLKKTLPENIAQTLRIESSHRLLLRKNYRNAQEVAQLAETFRPRDVIPAELPTRMCTEPPEIIQFKSYKETAVHIELIANNFSNKSIGIFVTRTDERDQLANAFKENNFANFQVYRTEDWRNPIDPCAKGVFIATNKVAKGLEFDVVIAAALESWPAIPSEEQDGVFYVLLSRSKDVLKLSYTGTDEPIFFKSHKHKDKINLIPRKPQ